MRHRTTFCTMGLFLAVLFGSPVSAQPAEEPAMDAQAAEVLRRFSEFHRRMRACEFQVDGHIHIAHPQKQIEKRIHAELTVAKPNQLDLRLNSEDDAQRIITDGRTVAHYIPAYKQYISNTLLPGEPVLDSTTLRIPFAAVLFADAPIAALKEGTLEIRYLDKATIDDGEHHHLRLVRDEGALDLWIAAGDRPLLRRVVLDRGDAIERAGRIGNVVTTLDFTAWKIDPELDPSRFAFEPPADAELVYRFRPPGPQAMTKQPAPDFELPDLNGGKVKLSDLKDKVVVLDFWASWCVHCARTLPIYAEVTAELADRGVVFYTINLREDVEKIRTFLEENKLDVNVLRDADGAVARQYRVRGVPRAFVIDRQGKIAHVHNALSLDNKQKLSEELKSLLGEE